MVIVCATRIAAGDVIMLLLQKGFLPAKDFRIGLAEDDPSYITITITSVRSAQQRIQLRTEIAAIPDTSV